MGAKTDQDVSFRGKRRRWAVPGENEDGISRPPTGDKRETIGEELGGGREVEGISDASAHARGASCKFCRYGNCLVWYLCEMV